MKDYVYDEFLIVKKKLEENLKNKENKKEDIFNYISNYYDKLKCYGLSKMLFVIKSEILNPEDKEEEKKFQKKVREILKEYIILFNQKNWENENIEKLDIEYLKSNIVEPSIPYTLAIFTNITLKQPYFSRDDEEYYYINNPILKDKATKTPMARGSGIKGKLSVCAAEVIYESINQDKNNLISELIKYLRIFGSGNDEIKTLNELLKKLFNSENLGSLTDKTKKEIAAQFINFILLNFGGKITKKTIDSILASKNHENIVNEIIDWINQNIKDKEEFKIQKGRLTFYPMYFNKINIEIINRHSREKRAGEAPIYFEVVPKGEKANLILVYTPFDIIFSKNKEEMRKEAEEDLDFIIKSLEKLQEEGIGAKRKYGWGQFEMKDKTIIKRNQDELKEYEGWTIE
ncbi:RAMP superfamily CRISPR-associated protein [Defluviitalea phaphyphila]|uniref:RAMP superfamily CRISPR-associated protein n=1 Tax=Defluviitalea phaphyphila TaxID=1473580 RepID=UPI00136569E0|nr:RAMP superfamily CRISPR-associated protein [Defluviitalea phaphyphila]